MAGRFLSQNLSSWMFRSTSRLDPHASACARAAAPVGRTPEGGATALGNIVHGAAVHPGNAVNSSCEIQGYAARYFNTVPLSHTDAKASRRATGMFSIINRVKPASMGSVKGAKRTFSSGASSKHEVPAQEIDIKAYGAALDRNATTCVVLSTLIVLSWSYSGDRTSSNKGQSNSRTSSNKGQSNSRHCPGCNCNSRHCPGCNCMAGVSK